MRVLVLYDGLTREAQKAFGAKGKINTWIDGMETAFHKLTSDNVSFGFASIHGIPGKTVTSGRFSYIGSLDKADIKKGLYRRKYEKALQLYQESYRKVVKEFNPDVIHVSGSEHPYVFVCSEFPEITIISIQGIRAVTQYYSDRYSEELAKQESLNSSPIKTIIKKALYGENIHWLSEYETNHIKNAKYINTQNEYSTMYFSMLNPDATYLQFEKIIRKEFYNSEWNPVNVSLNRVFTIISNQVSYKGYDTLVNTIIQLHKTGNREITFNIGGVRSDSPIGKIILKRLRSNGIPIASINFLGYLNTEQVVMHLQNTSVFALFSHIENTPNTLKEAQMMGVPCVAPYVGGVSSLLQDRKEGLIFQDTNFYSAASMILWLLRHPRQAIEYGRNARKRRLEDNNPEKITEQIIRAYHTIYESNRNKKQ